MPKKSSFIKIFFVVFFVLNICLITGAYYLTTLFAPKEPTNTSEVKFTIPKGQSITQIGDRLEENNLIKNSLAFKIFVKKENLSNKIQAGSFSLSPSMTLSQIAQTLTTGTEDAWVTFQEGWRREEIADSMERQGFEFFDSQEFLDLTQDQEGYLFPDTYLVPQQISANSLYNLLTNTFERKIQELEPEFAIAQKNASNPRTPEEIIIMASIVEREGKGYENLRYVAGILWNRLEIDMPLQVDATLQYIKGYNKTQQTWWPEPLAADKDLESPYNTYLNPGLPPQPISNPGLDALKATLNPIESDYLYYIHDNSGQGHYATTYDGHLDNINTYLR